MTFERAYNGARAFSVDKQRTTYVIALGDDYMWCTLDRWPKYERAGWKYVAMVTDEWPPLVASA